MLGHQALLGDTSWDGHLAIWTTILDWQERLESFKASGLSIDEFCLQEGVSRSTYYRWVDQLKDGMSRIDGG